MIQIFTRTMGASGFGRPYNIGYVDTVDQAIEYCRHAGEWEGGWRFRNSWRGPNGRAYEFRDVGTKYTGQKLSVDWKPMEYVVDGEIRRAMGFADLDLAGASVVRHRGVVWVRDGDTWRETKAKKYREPEE